MLKHSSEALGGALWAIVLAGGEGVRLRPLVREFCGDERPKQFAKIVGSKSLLSHTLDRVALKIPPEQTVIVTCRARVKYMAQEFAEIPRQGVLVQPDDRGTAAGIFLPAHWIDSQDPEAVVAVFPSDHFILEGSTFMSHIANVAAYVRQQSARLVLFGATANAPDAEYGWIEPGGPLGKSALILSCMSGDSGKSLRRAELGRAWLAAVYGTRWCLSREYRLCSTLGDDSFHASWRGWHAPLAFWQPSVRSQSNRSMGLRQRWISPEQSLKRVRHF